MSTFNTHQLALDLFTLGFDIFTFDEILAVLRHADDSYFNDEESLLKDIDYDALKHYAANLNPTHSYFLGTGSEVRGGKVKLAYPMGSLTQCYENDTIKWIKKYNLENQTVIITEKLDGYSTQIIYDKDGKLQIAFSRGDGLEGSDITRHISKIIKCPQQTNTQMVVRAEIILTEADFLILRELIKTKAGAMYKNARNMVSGLMNAETNNPIIYQYLRVIAYEIIQSEDDKERQLDMLEFNAFTIPRYESIQGVTINDDILTKWLNEWRSDAPYAIDGIVIDVDSHQLRQSINPTKDTLNPEYARKYKIADALNLAVTTVINVTFAISKDGYLKPTIHIDPVTLVGVTITKMTGFNAKYIYDNKIQPGCKIKVTRSGDVIPYCLGVVEPGPIQ